MGHAGRRGSHRLISGQSSAILTSCLVTCCPLRWHLNSLELNLLSWLYSLLTRRFAGPHSYRLLAALSP